MDSSQRALQTNGKLFFFISNLFLNYFPKTEKYSNKKRDVNIDQSAIYYISMDSILQALQTT